MANKAAATPETVETEAVDNEIVVDESAPKMGRQEAITAGYSFAQQKLRENHKAEFDALRKQHIAELGYPDWSPAPTKSEKAEAEIAKLLEEFPELREKFGA